MKKLLKSLFIYEDDPRSMIYRLTSLQANGYLEDIAIDKVKRFEKELLTELRNQTDILEEIASKKALDKELENRLVEAIEKFKKTF